MSVINTIHPFIDLWLINNTYDYISEPKYLSATSILKPLKSIVLSYREVPNSTIDLQDSIAASMGTAIHDSIEKAWFSKNLPNNLELLGHKNNIEVNPVEPSKDKIQVYLEQRQIKQFCGWKIGGKFDCIFDGTLIDVKTTSVYTYSSGSHDEDYIKQCSIYRWLNQDKVTSDTFYICFIFKDWTANNTYKSGYPRSRIVFKPYTLMSVEDTEAYLRNKLFQIDCNLQKPQDELPPCSDSELWRSSTVYKYYSDPTKVGGRSNKNFTSYEEALEYKASKASKEPNGIIITYLGQAKRCKYCPCNHICEQGMGNLYGHK